MRKRLSILMGCLLTFAVPVAAQVLDCERLAQQAILDFGQNCLNVETDTACYGHVRVDVTLTHPDAPVVFSQPSQRTRLTFIQAVQTSVANPAAGQWGLALVNLAIDTQANTTAHMLLIGDASLAINHDDTDTAQPTGFRTGFDIPACNEMPSAMAVQSSQPVDVTLNGANLRINGLIVLQWATSNSLTATTYSGQIDVIGGKSAQAGQTLVGVMDNTSSILFWSAPRPAKPAELSAAETAARAMTSAQITEDTPAPPIPSQTSPHTTCEKVIHTVQPGENLFRIALRYGTTMQAIAQANGITDINVIVVGQQLAIPCGVSGNALAGASNNPPPEEGSSPADTVSPANGAPSLEDCNFVAPTGPINVPFGSDAIISIVCPDS